MKSILLLLLLSISSLADVTFKWNAPTTTVTRYRFYEKIGDTWTRIGDTDALTLTLPVAPGWHVYTVTSFHNGLESIRSNELLIEVPAPPTDLSLAEMEVTLKFKPAVKKK